MKKYIYIYFLKKSLLVSLKKNSKILPLENSGDCQPYLPRDIFVRSCPWGSHSAPCLNPDRKMLLT